MIVTDTSHQVAMSPRLKAELVIRHIDLYEQLADELIANGLEGELTDAGIARLADRKGIRLFPVFG